MISFDIQRLLDAFSGKPAPKPENELAALQKEFGVKNAAEIATLLRQSRTEVVELHRKLAERQAERDLQQREVGAGDGREIARRAHPQSRQQQGDSELALLLISMDKAMKSLNI